MKTNLFFFAYKLFSSVMLNKNKQTNKNCDSETMLDIIIILET